MTYLSSLEDIKTNLKLSSVDDGEISKVLERANRMLMSKVGAYSIDSVYVRDDDKTTLQLRFKDIISITAIYLEGDEVDSGNYSVVEETGIVTFTGETFNNGNLIEVFYTHRLMADLEQLYAEKYLLARKFIVCEDETKNVRLDEIKEELNECINAINGNMESVRILDHRNRFVVRSHF